MNKIAVVTDSTADLTPAMSEELGVTVIPLAVNFGTKHYLDGIDIKSEEFYSMLTKADTLPTTSQPSPADFKHIYEKLLEDHDSVLSIHLSSGLSGTLESAAAAKELVKGDVHLFDSKSISLGIGAVVAEAVELVRKQLPIKEVVSRLEEAREKVHVLFTLDTLEYLHKGGRIGKVQAVMGALLNIKPIIQVVDGIYVPAGKARRTEQALKEIVSLFQSLTAGKTVKRMSVAHGAAMQTADRLATMMKETFKLDIGVFTQVGPVIGVHTGPGTIGACIQVE